MNRIETIEAEVVKSLHALVKDGEIGVCFSKDRNDRRPYYFIIGHEDQVDWTEFDKLGA